MVRLFAIKIDNKAQIVNSNKFCILLGNKSNCLISNNLHPFKCTFILHMWFTVHDIAG